MFINIYIYTFTYIYICTCTEMIQTALHGLDWMLALANLHNLSLCDWELYRGLIGDIKGLGFWGLRFGHSGYYLSNGESNGKEQGI